MKPIAIKDDIYWVGAVDYSSRDFHGYTLSQHGTTYNAYLVLDKKNTLFDTVKADHLDECLHRIRQVIEPKKIDYIVTHHLELDHSGSLPRLVELCKPEKIFCSPMGLRSMNAHFNTAGWPVEVKKTGDILSLGRRNVHFLEARMLHWPDSMFSYLAEDKILFSNDAFGQNIACSERFSDQLSREDFEHALKEYYYNIVQPYGPQVIKVLDHVTEMQLDIDVVAPDHGMVMRGKEEASFALEAYRRYATPAWKKRAIITYDTMWRSTGKMASSIGEGLSAVGIPYTIMPLKVNHHSTVVTALADAGAVFVGSPTHNNGMLPLVADLLTYMKGLRPAQKMGMAFGSFGWSGEAPKAIHEWLEKMGFEMPVAALSCNFVPTVDVLAQCYEAGKAVGEALAERCDAQ